MLRNLVSIMGMLGIVSCGSADGHSRRTKVRSCSVEETLTGAVIRCPDGSTATIFDGSRGEPGEAGMDGEDAKPASITCVVEESDDGA